MRSAKTALWEATDQYWTEGSVLATMPVWLASQALDAFCYSYIIRIKDKVNGH